jgi:DNA-binding MarR family transcriptional regulator
MVRAEAGVLGGPSQSPWEADSCSAPWSGSVDVIALPTFSLCLSLDMTLDVTGCPSPSEAPHHLVRYIYYSSCTVAPPTTATGMTSLRDRQRAGPSERRYARAATTGAAVIESAAIGPGGVDIGYEPRGIRAAMELDETGRHGRGMDDEQRVDLGVSLFIPYRYMEDRIFRTLQDAGFDDWTLAQCRVFQRIHPDGSRLTDLADQAQMSKQSAGVLVDELQRLGYVRRVPDPTDGRARLIVIEQRGRRAVEVAMATRDEILAQWQAYLGTRNFALLHQILDQLREITDPYAR